jgi:glycosyltransferase involved in cell wall biosynthesis
MQRISVIITNYNYAEFVGFAIESALALDWPDVEVVVVDDGSTDESLTAIRAFGDRVTVLETENGKQRVAANRGFSVSSGDVVVFLDSDDLLPPDLPLRLAAVWTQKVSKAQFTMQRIGREGEPFGRPFPEYDRVPTSDEIRYWAERTTAYPTPPGSANAYARWFLSAIMPVGPEAGDAADSALLAAAPFFGEVVTVPQVVVSYRRHGANDSSLVEDVSRFPREVGRARARWNFAKRASGAMEVDERPLFCSRELLQLRIASRVLVPDEHPLPGDSAARMLRDSLLSPLQPGPERWRRRMLVALWCVATLASPVSLARRMVLVRYRAAH